MSRQEAKVTFDYNFVGELSTDRGQVQLGMQEGGMLPYNLLLGALASCLYATFLEIAQKKKIEFDQAEFEVLGEKREAVPTTLETVEVILTIEGAEASARKGLEKSLDLASKYCSIYQTIGQVAKMSHKLVVK